MTINAANIIATQKYRMVSGVYASPGRPNIYPPNYVVPPVPPVDSVTPWLPFEMTSAMLNTMKASPKKLYPVNVMQFNPYWNQVSGYPASYFPPGQSSPTPATAGWFRDYYYTPASDTSLTAARTREMLDYKAAGLDAYVLDYLGGTTYATDMTACGNAAIASGTKIILQPDGSLIQGSVQGGNGQTGAQDSATVCINYMSAFPNAYERLSDGTYLCMPYFPERYGKDGTWWQWFKDAMSAGGFPVSIIGCMQGAPSTAGAYPWYGAGVWGGATPDSLTDGGQTHGGWPAFCASNGQKSFQWVRTQDDRPKGSASSDPNGFDMLLKTFTLANNCDGAFIPTTNDFTEGAQMARTRGSGYGWLDLFAYYTYKFKTNTYPQIVRDGLYILHRKQFAAYAGTQTTPFGSWQGTPRDQVSCLCFLTAPANVTVAGVTTTNVPAGVTQLKVPLQYGTISASAVRSGVTVSSVTSPHTVVDAGVSTKLNYVTSSFSGREGQAFNF